MSISTKSNFEKRNGGNFKCYTHAILANIRLAVLSSKCTITWVNDKFCRLVNYEQHELIGKPIYETNLVCMDSDEFRAIHGLISSGQAWSGEIKSRTRLGGLVWFKTNILPIIKRSGEVGSYLILSSDITATKAALEAKNEIMETLTRSEARYRALVENQPDLMSLCNAEGVRIFVNEKYCHFAGKTQHELIGTSIKDFPIRGLPIDLINRVFEVITFDNPEISGVYELENSKGEKVWMSLCVRGIFDNQGKLFEILTTGRDVTDLKKAEITLSKYIEDLERIAFMTSHKVRAPIATMLGLLELLRIGAIHGDQWSDVFTSFEKCVGDLDLYTKELGSFINQRQSVREEDMSS
jgi:PAS domain S-box-containing protein